MAAVASGSFKTIFTYRAVTCCLILGLLQLLAMLVAIQVINGHMNISSISRYDEKFNWAKTIAFMTYRTYFRDNCTTENDEAGWSCKAPATFRTYYWILHYTAMCTIWVLTSLLLLVFVPEHKKITCFGQLYRYWWMMVTTIVVISDAFVSIQYLLDLEHTCNELEYFRFLGFNSSVTISIPIYLKTTYIYFPPILMSLIFSRGIIGWILVVIILISALKHFRSPEPAPKVEQPEENQNDSDENSIRNEDTTTSSTTTLTEVAPSNSPAEQSNYVPWMNVLYLPSIYEESNPDKVPEYYDEHHYEHVIGPHDVPGGITIEIPSKHKKETIDLVDDEQKKSNPKLMKIDVGNICIQINQRNRDNAVTAAPYYQNMKFMKIPRVSGPCQETECNVHRAFSFMSAQDDKLHSDT